MGYLGYDVVREIERLPDIPRDDLGHPDAALVVIGQFAAFDHWRQRISLIDNVVVPDGRPGEGPTAEELETAYEAACARLVELAARLRADAVGGDGAGAAPGHRHRPRPAAP